MKQPLSSTIKALISSNKAFINSNLNSTPKKSTQPNTQHNFSALYSSSYFESIAESQAPKLLWFGCSDSRTSITTLANIPLNTVFASRNIANIVSDSDTSTLSILDFAVTALAIRSIVVCGHTNCGGIINALKLATSDPPPKSIPKTTAEWLKPVISLYNSNEKLIGNYETDPLTTTIKMSQFNTFNSVNNIKKHLKLYHPSIAADICVAALFLDLRTGLISPL
ncbi:hypothetical protein BB561_004393 [Smittium simulii]|uniref:Carbonic anhydrase n=1 Tax=Smittium simulii TaxID=133385 RepID=A0A2T9YGH1_9FUNG|nr:hypothetical protein BB561_004393 [Smittium simulii]